MGRTGFFNDNENRGYPFVPDVTGDPAGDAGTVDLLPDSVIVDCGFLMGLGSDFEEGSHSVYLSRVSRSGFEFTFEFSSDAPGLFGSSLSFVRDFSDGRYLTSFSDTVSTDSDSASLSASPDCPEPDLWSGFLVTGTFDDLEELIGDGEAWVGSVKHRVEPALARSMVASFVNSINLANGDRTRADAPDGCTELVYPFETDQVYTNATCLQGELFVKPGYNLSISQGIFTNELVLSANVGAGEGEVCDEIKLFDTESAISGKSTLDGSERCSETIRSINGIGGELLSILGGSGVTVSSDSNANKITIDIDFGDLEFCFVEPVSE